MRLGQAILFVKGSRTESWVEFEAGAAKLALHAIPASIAAGIEIKAPPEVREETPIKLVFEVDDVEAEIARLEALGVAVIRRPWGGCDGIDPEGNVFHVARG